MTMHGAFWSFPKTFSAANTSGIRVRSAYMKVIGDFTRWNDRLVFGCDDSAKSEFLNKRQVKGGIDSVGQSQSNLWFTSPDTPDKLGPAHASGAVWLHDSVKAGERPIRFSSPDGSTAACGSSSITPPANRSAEMWSVTTNGCEPKAEKDSKDFSVLITLSNGDARDTTPTRFSTASPESAMKTPKPAFSALAAKTSAR
jgi:hypothetical protein